MLSLYSSSYFSRDAMRAPCTNSALGANVRFSTEYDSMALVSVIAASNSPTDSVATSGFSNRERGPGREPSKAGRGLDLVDVVAILLAISSADVGPMPLPVLARAEGAFSGQAIFAVT